ncbi:LOW QUALITY PROTEIN: hypothetical protein Cgig2_024907 [Carnegiea gigantea]|uniref:Uncharacterized protein n=1 Tax=Carnegiea gigantea TaxID=171969 RepID=A0A9Q1QG44_9CARY|nr:LOW QUALITY PROTEIN: hypothetical protein Cgig2_024907 [Carnegiea gigantea]
MIIQSVPGMSDFLLPRDLPKPESPHNHSETFEDLEGLILSHLQAHYTRTYSIGPLHAHLKHILGLTERTVSNSSSSLWEEDRSCTSWLDQKPDKSVIYSWDPCYTYKTTRDQVMEIWAGLVRSEKYFLWLVQPDMVTGTDPDGATRDELLEGTKERGLVHVTSRFVSEVWTVGLDKKDTSGRSIGENMVRELMDARRDELQPSMAKMSNLPQKKSINEGGSAYCNFDRLIEDIKLMSKTG